MSTSGTNITRLATVGARGNSGSVLSGPSPVSAPSVPILEIGAPTSVTINGVTVTSSSSEEIEIIPNNQNDINETSHKLSNVSTFKVCIAYLYNSYSNCVHDLNFLHFPVKIVFFSNISFLV